VKFASLTTGHMRKLIFAAAAAAIVSAGAHAQGSAPRPLELGIDAGVTIGLGDDAFTTISIPAQAFRVGFPISPRTSLEPKLAVNIITGNGDTFTTYRAELGLLYHLGSDRYPGAYQRAGLYVRPFLGIVGFADGDSDSAGILGGGFRGVRINVDGNHAGGPGPGRCEGEYARSRSHVGHAFAAQVETREKVREEFAGEKISRVEHGRSDREPETRYPRHRRPATLEDEMIREKVDGLAQKLL